MKIDIFAPSLDKKTIFFSWVSLLWQPRYNDEGSFSVELRRTNETFDDVELGDYVTYSGDDSNTVMAVTGIQINGDTVIITGCSAAYYILSRRVHLGAISTNSAEDIIRNIIARMAVWDNFQLGKRGNIPDYYFQGITDGLVWKVAGAVAKITDIGFKVTKSGAMLLFECYKPGLTTTVRFSRDLGNITNEAIVESDVNYANVAVVAGVDTDGATVTVNVGATDQYGSLRREIYFDARSETMTDDETLEDYMARLRDFGETKLAAYALVSSVQFGVTSESVSLGDVVRIRSSYLGKMYEARITGIDIQSQKNMTTKTIRIGTPVPISKGGR